MDDLHEWPAWNMCMARQQKHLQKAAVKWLYKVNR